MYFVVALMINFRMRALDERLLLAKWDDDSLFEYPSEGIAKRPCE
jgi:hypothetical protein